MEQAKTKISKVVGNLQESFSSVIGVDMATLQAEPEAEICSSDIIKKANDLDQITTAMKSKLATADHSTQIQILTLTPESWSRRYAANYFEMSESTVRLAMELKKSKGILGTSVRKPRTGLSDVTVQMVQAFYENDEYSRLMPGKKDFVSIGRNVHQQKRLLLCNLKELHAAFMEKHPDYKCTIHLVVIYFKEEGKLNHQSLCCISDDLEHDTGFVHALQSQVVSYLAKEHLSIKHIHYFSDGCAAQYKNYKNILNLCYHHEDFNVRASWSFFASSHGKSPCDGVGGVVKRLLSRASLQRATDNQILTVEAVLDFCINKIYGIHFIFLSKEILGNIRTTLGKRFLLGHTIPGTRSFHHFEPLSSNSVGYKRTSQDPSYTGIYTFQTQLSSVLHSSASPMDYVVCRYDDNWWIGIVQERNQEENDIEFLQIVNVLLQRFSSYGEIIKCRLVRDIVTGFSKCYAFIEYEDISAARNAYTDADKTGIDGNEVSIEFECERLVPGWIPRRLGGGWGGNKKSGQLRFGGRDRPFRKPLIINHDNHNRRDQWKRKPDNSKDYHSRNYYR
ncbi:U11/U12 small nuclear ribonucleoprotein [Nymphon striatum]|nr:U11/U12 small nuclear ribonucleoprotein [Nymphon striatum]